MAGSKIFETITEPLTELRPAPTMTAPISPPKSACDELEGSPTSHVTRFQMIAPSSPAKTMGAVISESSKQPTRDRFGYRSGQACSGEIEYGGKDDGDARPKSTRRDGPGHRIGTVMKAVGEIEDQGYDNDRDDDEQLGHISSPSGTGGVVSGAPAMTLEPSRQVNNR